MYVVEVSSNLTRPGPARPRWPSGFCEPHILATMRVMNMTQKMRTFLNCDLSNFLKQSTKPSEHEIYSNRENFKKLTFVRVISPNLSELEIWNKKLILPQCCPARTVSIQTNVNKIQFINILWAKKKNYKSYRSEIKTESYRHSCVGRLIDQVFVRQVLRWKLFDIVCF